MRNEAAAYVKLVTEFHQEERAQVRQNEDQELDQGDGNLVYLTQKVLEECEYCPTCREGDTATCVPKSLMEIHRGMVHTSVGEKIVRT